MRVYDMHQLKSTIVIRTDKYWIVSGELGSKSMLMSIDSDGEIRSECRLNLINQKKRDSLGNNSRMLCLKTIKLGYRSIILVVESVIRLHLLSVNYYGYLTRLHRTDALDISKLKLRFFDIIVS